MPDFHDGEIIGLSLARSGPSILRVYPYDPKKPAVVDFIFEEITDLSLEDFSPQNVIFLLTAERVARQIAGWCEPVVGRRQGDSRAATTEISPARSAG